MGNNGQNKDYKNSQLYTYAVSFIGGATIRIIFPPFSLLGLLLEYYAIVSMGYSAWHWSRFDKLFRNLNMCKDGAYPILRHKKKTDVSTIYCFSMPCGMCMKDFDNNYDRFKAYLGKDLDIKETYKEIEIEVFNEPMKELYEYVPTKIDGIAPIMVGYDRKSKLITCDLGNGEPHMGIFGETGAGKSTVMRAIITNLLLTTDIILHLVDLKNGAEFNIFKKSRNVRSFCRNSYETKNLLNDISVEVDRRYDLFYECDVKDAREYNKKFKNKKLDTQILVIDEFADLQGDKECMALLQEIVRKARACHIFVVIGCQRPDCKILEGGIKSNISSIIGLKTQNAVNSQIIIDSPGLEKLRGKGHSIFKRSGKTEVQCPYLDTDRARELIKPTNIEQPKPTVKKEPELSDSDLENIFDSF